MHILPGLTAKPHLHLVVAAIAAPALVAVAVALGVSDPAQWLVLKPAPRVMIALNALTAEAGLVTILAPLAGVLRRPWRAATAAFVCSSMVTLVLIAMPPAELVARFLTGHLVLLATAIAGAGLGACARACFELELDAAAASLFIAVALTLGGLLIGPVLGTVPTPVVNAVLAANPVVATAAAADIDLLRTDVLYRLSPIAHRQFDYPSWQATTVAYGGFALLTWGVVTIRDRRSPRH